MHQPMHHARQSVKPSSKLPFDKRFPPHASFVAVGDKDRLADDLGVGLTDGEDVG